MRFNGGFASRPAAEAPVLRPTGPMMTSLRSRIPGLVALLLLAACSPQPAAPPAPDVPEVSVQVVRPVSGAHVETLVGRLGAVRSAEVRARVGGILLERVYSEGRDVAAGELMFRIDPAPLVAEQRAREAELARAVARATNARTRAERFRGLSGRGVIPAQELEDAEAAEREAAAAELEAKAQLDKARLALSWAEVRAPIAGRAGKALVTEGALVGDRESTALTLIEQIDTLNVDFHVSVGSWELLRAMQAAGELPALTLRSPSGREHAHPATVQFSDLAVEPGTGTIALRATVPNPDGALLPGMFVSIDVAVGSSEAAVRVPQTAVLRDGAGAFAYVLGEDGLVERRTLRLDGSVGNEWLVAEGLAEGDRLVLDGLQRLRPGAPARAAADAP
jgi:membrane fusion protein, multidrug efflux system